MFNFAAVAAVAFVISAVLGIFLIPLLHRLKFGQEIRDEGPKWHKKKSGTPTMGGLIFIFASVLALLAVCIAKKSFAEFKACFAIMGCALAFGAVGFLDDYIKVILKRNLGLTAGQKFSLQVLVSLVYTACIVGFGGINTEVFVPFAKVYINLGYFVVPLNMLVMLATVNSVNLTDGLDGLAATVTVIVAVFFAAAAKKAGAQAPFEVCAAVCGGLLGFLIYNKYPAKVFMGDTGSLFLGGALAAVAVYLKNPLILILVGFVYVAEALSVIIQVTYFKKTGKRIFKMSPIHHHFEMCGFSERKIVIMFSAATALLSVIGYLAV